MTPRDPRTDATGTLTAERPAGLGARPRHERRWQRVGLRALASWALCVVTFGVADESSGSVAVAALVLTAVWLPFAHRVAQSWRAMPLALGPVFVSVTAAALAYVAAGAVFFTAPWAGVSAAALALACLALAGAHSLWNLLEDRGARRPERVVIVGGDTSVARLIEDASEEGARYEFVAVVADDPSPEVRALPVRRRPLDELEEAVEELSPDLVVVAATRGRPRVFEGLLAVAYRRFTVVGLPEFYEVAFGQLPVRALTPAWFMSTLHLYNRPYNRITKRGFDIVVAVLGLVVTAVLWPLIVLVVKRTPGPLLYRQVRLGEHGRPFTMIKFRTMSAGAEDDGAARWAEENDPRLIWGGSVMRRLRLDEIPQLWNVLRGEMSIVGPRPERPEFIAELQRDVPFWRQRELLKPGITGWAQVRSDYAADSAGSERKLSYDLWYLRHRSLLLDTAICMRTLGTMVTGSGAR